MGKPKINLGVVGCGDIAGYTALVSKLVPQVRLAGCCDLEGRRARSFAKKNRISQVYTDYHQMLDEADLDAVYLAIPHHLHYAMTLEAVRAGKPVLLEKPLALTLEEGIRLVEETSGQKVGVNYQYRYDKGCYALARAVQAGSLGKVNSVRVNIPWRRELSYFDSAPWHKSLAQSGGGTLLTQGSHFLDVALWALGEKPVSVVGYTASPGDDIEVESLAQGVIETQSGSLVSITSSMVCSSEQRVTIEVYGECGTAVYTDKPLPRVKFTDVKVRQQRPPAWGIHALQRSLAGFARWVLEDQPYLTPAKEALPVLAAVEGIYTSAKSGRREMIEE